MNKNVRFMSKVAKDIIDATANGKGRKSYKQLKESFYEIMRKHGIKQGTKSGNGRLISNPEWVMCQELFWSSIGSANRLGFMLEDPPEDLQAY